LTQEDIAEVEKILARRVETLKQYRANLIALPL
jgi:hypothetical protein